MLQCPVCHKEDMAEPSDGKRPKYYPFCSGRCKLIDLGAWLDGEYSLESDGAPENPDVNDDGYA